jgi:hypothetical protein
MNSKLQKLKLSAFLPTFFLLFISNVGFLFAADTPIKKALLAYYYFTPTEAAFISSHFSYLDTFLSQPISTLQNIKGANPNLKVFGYKDLIAIQTYDDDWAEVNSHEDWFVHNAGGQRIQHVFWGWYLMDVGNAGWRQHWVSYVNSKLTANQYYDGVFLDDVWDNLPADSSLFNAIVPPAVISRWHADTIGMLQHIKTNIETGKLVFINSNEYATDDYLALVDGQMLEGYEHADWVGIDDFYTWPEGVLARKSATGKIIVAASGTMPDSDTVKMNAMLKYCYAGYLLGMNGSNAYWSYNSWGHADGAKGYYPIMDTDLGQSAGASYASQGVSMRDFSAGKVLFNPSPAVHVVAVGGDFKLLDGTTVSSVTLTGWSAEVLLLSSPTTTPSSTPTVTPTPTTTSTPAGIPSAAPASATQTPIASTAVAAGAAFPNPFRPGRGQTARFSLTLGGSPHSCIIQIMTIKGRVVRTLNNVQEWDGRDEQGRPCEGGLYLFRIEAENRRVNGTIVLLNE